MARGNLPGDSRAYQIQIPCGVFFVVTTFVVTVRLWARIKLRSWAGIGWDDGVIVISWVFASAVSALMIASCSYGFGQHIANLTELNKLMTLKLFYVAQGFYKLTINLTKTSILLLYLRIFVKKWFRITCFTLLAVVLLYMVATFAASVWQCIPISRAWDKSIAGTCINISANWYANAGFSISTDFIILALPMYPIYTSMLPLGQKVALMVVFALGVFTTITSILRMQTLDFSIKSPDITYDIDSSVWTMIEMNLAIVCACLPTCRLPLAYAFPAYFSSTDSTKKLVLEAGGGRDSTAARHSYASMSRFPGGANALPSLQVHDNERNSSHDPHSHHREKSLTELTAGSPSTGSPATIGWEPEFEGGARYNVLSHVSTCGTLAPGEVESRAYSDDNGPGHNLQSQEKAKSLSSSTRRKRKDNKGMAGMQHDRTDSSGSGVIRMVTHYSITYDDNKPPQTPPEKRV